MPGMAGGAQRGVYVVGLRLVLEKVGSNAVLSGLRCCQQDWEDVETPSGDSQKYRTWCRWVVGVVTQASGSKTSDICVGVNEMPSDSKSLTN